MNDNKQTSNSAIHISQERNKKRIHEKIKPTRARFCCSDGMIFLSSSYVKSFPPSPPLHKHGHTHTQSWTFLFPSFPSFFIGFSLLSLTCRLLVRGLFCLFFFCYLVQSMQNPDLLLAPSTHAERGERERDQGHGRTTIR